MPVAAVERAAVPSRLRLVPSGRCSHLREPLRAQQRRLQQSAALELDCNSDRATEVEVERVLPFELDSHPLDEGRVWTGGLEFPSDC